MELLCQALRLNAPRHSNTSILLHARMRETFRKQYTSAHFLHTDIHQESPLQPRRAILYVPGSSEKMLAKAKNLQVDCVCLDLEDGVSATVKDKARSNIRCLLDSHPAFAAGELAVRINSIVSGLAERDLDSMFNRGSVIPPCLVIPKVDNVDHVKWLIDRLELCRPGQPWNLITQVESAEGLVNLLPVTWYISRNIGKIGGIHVGMIFGSDDNCSSIGAKRSPNGEELLYARQKIVAIAKSFKLQAIDMVHIDFKDTEALRKYSLQGSAMGFTGKQIIHPSQVPVVHAAFSPSKEQVVWAAELLKAFATHEQQGKGAFVFRDQMIDKPSVLQARNIKLLADRIVKFISKEPAS